MATEALCGAGFVACWGICDDHLLEVILNYQHPYYESSQVPTSAVASAMSSRTCGAGLDCSLV